jgi:ribonuclease P protein component
MNEAHLPTERPKKGQDPRIPQTNVDQGRTGGDPVPPGEGAPSAVGVTCGSGPARDRGAGIGRIRSRRSFEAVRHGSSRGRSGPVTVSYLEQPSWSRPQVAYAISRRVGSAVVRNRLRRRLRAIVFEGAASLPVGAYVVRTGPDGTLLGFDELKVAMSRAVERATRGRTGAPLNGPADGCGPVR